MQLKTLDLNLLKVLDALMAERNVTRAAAVLGRTQPAVSNALHRLREIFADDLFVRGPQGFALTPRAEKLRRPLQDAMAILQDGLFEDAPFRPDVAIGLFRISTPDRLSLAVVPHLFDRLQRLAPHMSLQIATADRGQALGLLEDEKIDLALCWPDQTPGYLRSEVLLEEELYCVFRKRHPLALRRREFGIEDVLSFPHIVVSATGGRAAIFDDLLARQGLRRDARVSVTNFTAVPHLLAGSDMIGVFTRLASRVFETSFGLARRPVPLDVGKISTSMVWHARNERDARHVWLRDQIRSIYTDLQQPAGSDRLRSRARTKALGKSAG